MLCSVHPQVLPVPSLTVAWKEENLFHDKHRNSPCVEAGRPANVTAHSQLHVRGSSSALSRWPRPCRGSLLSFLQDKSFSSFTALSTFLQGLPPSPQSTSPLSREGPEVPMGWPLRTGSGMSLDRETTGKAGQKCSRQPGAVCPSEQLNGTSRCSPWRGARGTGKGGSK